VGVVRRWAVRSSGAWEMEEATRGRIVGEDE